MKILDCEFLIFCTNFKINEVADNLVFVTDGGANLVKGLRNDTQLRCACHCLNLAIEYGLSNSSEELTSIVDSCKKLVAHFKRADLQKQFQHDGIVSLLLNLL